MTTGVKTTEKSVPCGLIQRAKLKASHPDVSCWIPYYSRQINAELYIQTSHKENKTHRNPVRQRKKMMTKTMRKMKETNNEEEVA
jgi:hypothetical protein